MGFLRKLFGRSENSGDSDNSDVALENMLFECEECMRMVPDEEYYEGLCYDCIEDSQSTKYCCGMIYEEGETECASCGEPL